MPAANDTSSETGTRIETALTQQTAVLKKMFNTLRTMRRDLADAALEQQPNQKARPGGKKPGQAQSARQGNGRDGFKKKRQAAMR